MPITINPDAFYTTEETCELLGVGQKSLEAGRARGDGVKYTKIGRRILYKGEHILDRLQAGTRRSTADKPFVPAIDHRQKRDPAPIA